MAEKKTRNTGNFFPRTPIRKLKCQIKKKNPKWILQGWDTGK